MKGRIPRPIASLSDDKALAKRGRGSSEMIVRQDHKVALVKWFDNKPILLLSASHGIHPVDQCRRWEKKEKKYIQIERPSVIREYNSKMGGVDLCDRMISFYRMKIRTKKWTVRAMMHFFDLSLVNSWILYREDCIANQVPRKDIHQCLEFRMEIAQAYLVATDSSSSSSSGSDSDDGPPPARRPRTTRPADDRRFSSGKHLPMVDDRKNSVRCKNPCCSYKTMYLCQTCKVHLCLLKERNCFSAFHQEDR